ncbi:MAG: hypothetical protein WCK15_10215 [Pirellula sp.]
MIAQTNRTSSDATITQTPRAGRQRAAEVLKQVYGGDQEYFKSVSPQRLAEQNAEAIIEGSLVRQVCGDKDKTFGPNCRLPRTS